MAIYLVLLKTHAGLAAAHYVDADAHDVSEAGTHRLYRDERLVWQGQESGVRGVKRFEDREEAKHWHKHNRHELAAAEMAYRHEHSTGEGASPFVGGMSVRFGPRGEPEN